MQEVVLRTVALLDAERVAAFQIACWQEAYRGLVPEAFLNAMDLQIRTEAWRRRIELREREVVLAVTGIELVGVARWTPAALTELNTLYVSERARGTGLAARLLEAAIADGPATLWVFSGNARALRFYEKHGFDLEGERRIDAGTGIEETRLTRLTPSR